MDAGNLLEPGQRYCPSGGGWPPLSVMRDEDGRYFEERLSMDLARVVRREISEEDAAAWITEDTDQG